MIRFNNDYNHGAHPRILEALAKSNTESYGGYGQDIWCEKAAEEIKRCAGCPDGSVHFLIGGTQANFTVIAAALRPYQGVISPETGHINAHETGAVENCGHKIFALPAKDGKITATQIEKEAETYASSSIKEHIVQPKLVYLSYPTEYGTLYSKKELEEIYEVCQKYGLFLFIDGARLGYGIGSPEADLTFKDFSALSDVFTCGGTKCGTLFGEAVVITNHRLKEGFRCFMKQNGAMLAKGWLLGLQFYTLFQDGLYFEITKQAVDYAMKIKSAFERKGISFYAESFTNQQFVLLNQKQMEKLAENCIFKVDEKVNEQLSCVRFCTSWSTTEEEVNALVTEINKL
ncbi:MAG: aminotransferase class I/II-fold pyridoxal phosphate-dependent enzyme [Lachnospiraceae bacterium]|nr:aminotransferase class I/II-fold pyridoxal phosphate-dependent enzyme [Lachnospiraceae bacterium]